MTLIFLVLSLPICPGPCFDWCTFPFLTQISRLTRRRPVLHPVWAVVLFVPKYSLCVRTCWWCFFLLGCSFLCLYLSDKMKLNSSLEVSLQPSSISEDGFTVLSALRSHCSLHTKRPLARSGAGLPSEPAVPLLRITCAQHNVQHTSDDPPTWDG